jgi:hypothetical protein
VPDLSKRLESNVPIPETLRLREPAQVNGDFDWPQGHTTRQTDVLSYSSAGESFTGMGCFQLGLQCTSLDFDGLVEGQRRLRDLGMLHLLPSDEIKEMSSVLRTMHNALAPRNRLRPAIDELLELLEDASEDEEKRTRLRVWIGLQSGKKQWAKGCFSETAPIVVAACSALRPP